MMKSVYITPSIRLFEMTNSVPALRVFRRSGCGGHNALFNQSRMRATTAKCATPVLVPGKGRTECRVNENTGCHCVNGVYRIGLHGVCAIRVLCHPDDDSDLNGHVSKGPRIPPGAQW
ncbi:hypothetical protein MRX96_022258 [Rhipicephalus microplus]